VESIQSRVNKMRQKYSNVMKQELDDNRKMNVEQGDPVEIATLLQKLN